MEIKYPLLLVLIPLLIGGFYGWFKKRLHKPIYFVPNLKLYLTIQKLAAKNRRFNFYPLLTKLALILTLISLVVLVSRPLTRQSLDADKTGLDIMFVVDISSSMNETDISPTRIKAGANFIQSFVSKLTTDRVGIVIFKRLVRTLVPLTFDYQTVIDQAKTLDNNLIPKSDTSEGTAIGDGLILGVEKFPKDLPRTKIIILLTDGEPNFGIEPLKAATYASERQVKIYTLLLGKEAKLPGGNYDSLLKLLQDISAQTGGKAYSIIDANNLDSAFNDIAKLERTQLKITTNSVEVDDPFFWTVLTIIFMSSYLYLRQKTQVNI